jgi:thiamine-monophosphate kinase
MTVADLTERELVARIQRRLPPAPAWLLVGIGDDAAVVEPERNRVEVLTVDALVEGVHFDRAFVPPEAIGHRALAVNLSDLAAMGAAPRLALLSMALPAALPVDDFDAVADGIAALAAAHRVHVAGGNLTRSPAPLVLDITVTGTVKRRQALTRGGARPGDEVYVSGTIGAATAGLAQLREVASHKSQVASQSHVAGLADAYSRPEPRVRLGVMLARNRAASACIDLSDGLADGAHRLAEASSVGMIVDAAALPIDVAARAWFESHGADPVRAALTGGDDYELLFTVRPRTGRRLREVERHGGVAITRIGKCTDGGGVALQCGNDTTPMPGGYSHFARLNRLRPGFRESRSDA